MILIKGRTNLKMLHVRNIRRGRINWYHTIMSQTSYISIQQTETSVERVSKNTLSSKYQPCSSNATTTQGPYPTTPERCSQHENNPCSDSNSLICSLTHQITPAGRLRANRKSTRRYHEEHLTGPPPKSLSDGKNSTTQVVDDKRVKSTFYSLPGDEYHTKTTIQEHRTDSEHQP